MFTHSMNALKALKENDTMIIFDCETTGLDKKADRIIQLSAVKLKKKDDGGFSVIEYLDEYLNPGLVVSPKIQEITGISNEMLIDKPDEKTAYGKIKDFFDKNAIYAGQNVQFDIGFLEEMFKRCDVNGVFSPKDVIDSLNLARELIPRGSLKDNSYKLENVAEYYGVKGDIFHNAIEDVLNTMRVIFSELNDARDKGVIERNNNMRRRNDVIVKDLKRTQMSYKTSDFVTAVLVFGNETGEVNYSLNKHEFVHFKTERLSFSTLVDEYGDYILDQMERKLFQMGLQTFDKLPKPKKGKK